MEERSLFRAAYYQLIPAIFQQLNFAEWPQFRAWTGGPLERKSALTSGLPVIRE
jgi:hypothetical protein